MFSRHTLRKIAICVVFLLLRSFALAADASTVNSACELTGICTFQDAKLFLRDDPDGDMNGSGHMTLIDGNGKSLKFSFSQAGVTVTRPDLRKETLVSKGPEEVCLLAVTKRSFEKAFNPPLKSDDVDKKKYFTQWTVAAFIKKVERRWEKSEKANPGK